ncbi:hypothetical protein B0H17DRAFT_1187647 [Mycena rosella]|uniref:Uncharacterized protein n=1 Tax=Mycena rosella TaxID=1033263 RepID=A0AAD7BVN1_MYCRO|nr:hypothetical protein B0H17DRAFT_1187647 [Mycena rosella]
MPLESGRQRAVVLIQAGAMFVLKSGGFCSAAAALGWQILRLRRAIRGGVSWQEEKSDGHVTPPSQDIALPSQALAQRRLYLASLRNGSSSGLAKYEPVERVSFNVLQAVDQRPRRSLQHSTKFNFIGIRPSGERRQVDSSLRAFTPPRSSNVARLYFACARGARWEVEAADLVAKGIASASPHWCGATYTEGPGEYSAFSPATDQEYLVIVKVTPRFSTGVSARLYLARAQVDFDTTRSSISSEGDLVAKRIASAPYINHQISWAEVVRSQARSLVLAAIFFSGWNSCQPHPPFLLEGRLVAAHRIFNSQHGILSSFYPAGLSARDEVTVGI